MIRIHIFVFYFLAAFLLPLPSLLLLLGLKNEITQRNGKKAARFIVGNIFGNIRSGVRQKKFEMS
jgi:membrane protein YqaA with SNARE-associated domain